MYFGGGNNYMTGQNQDTEYRRLPDAPGEYVQMPNHDMSGRRAFNPSFFRHPNYVNARTIRNAHNRYFPPKRYIYGQGGMSNASEECLQTPYQDTSYGRAFPDPNNHNPVGNANVAFLVNCVPDFRPMLPYAVPNSRKGFSRLDDGSPFFAKKDYSQLPIYYTTSKASYRAGDFNGIHSEIESPPPTSEDEYPDSFSFPSSDESRAVTPERIHFPYGNRPRSSGLRCHSIPLNYNRDYGIPPHEIIGRNQQRQKSFLGNIDETEEPNSKPYFPQLIKIPSADRHQMGEANAEKMGIVGKDNFQQFTDTIKIANDERYIQAAENTQSENNLKKSQIDDDLLASDLNLNCYNIPGNCKCDHCSQPYQRQKPIFRIVDGNILNINELHKSHKNSLVQSYSSDLARNINVEDEETALDTKAMKIEFVNLIHRSKKHQYLLKENPYFTPFCDSDHVTSTKCSLPKNENWKHNISALSPEGIFPHPRQILRYSRAGEFEEASRNERFRNIMKENAISTKMPNMNAAVADNELESKRKGNDKDRKTEDTGNKAKSQKKRNKDEEDTQEKVNVTTSEKLKFVKTEAGENRAIEKNMVVKSKENSTDKAQEKRKNKDLKQEVKHDEAKGAQDANYIDIRSNSVCLRDVLACEQEKQKQSSQDLKIIESSLPTYANAPSFHYIKEYVRKHFSFASDQRLPKPQFCKHVPMKKFIEKETTTCKEIPNEASSGFRPSKIPSRQIPETQYEYDHGKNDERVIKGTINTVLKCFFRNDRNMIGPLEKMVKIIVKREAILTTNDGNFLSMIISKTDEFLATDVDDWERTRLLQLKIIAPSLKIEVKKAHPQAEPDDLNKCPSVCVSFPQNPPVSTVSNNASSVNGLEENLPRNMNDHSRLHTGFVSDSSKIEKFVDIIAAEKHGIENNMIVESKENSTDKTQTTRNDKDLKQEVKHDKAEVAQDANYTDFRSNSVCLRAFPACEQEKQKQNSQDLIINESSIPNYRTVAETPLPHSVKEYVPESFSFASDQKFPKPQFYKYVPMKKFIKKETTTCKEIPNEASSGLRSLKIPSRQIPETQYEYDQDKEDERVIKKTINTVLQCFFRNIRNMIGPLEKMVKIIVKREAVLTTSDGNFLSMIISKTDEFLATDVNEWDRALLLQLKIIAPSLKIQVKEAHPQPEPDDFDCPTVGVSFPPNPPVSKLPDDACCANGLEEKFSKNANDSSNTEIANDSLKSHPNILDNGFEKDPGLMTSGLPSFMNTLPKKSLKGVPDETKLLNPSAENLDDFSKSAMFSKSQMLVDDTGFTNDPSKSPPNISDNCFEKNPGNMEREGSPGCMNTLPENSLKGMQDKTKHLSTNAENLNFSMSVMPSVSHMLVKDQDNMLTRTIPKSRPDSVADCAYECHRVMFDQIHKMFEKFGNGEITLFSDDKDFRKQLNSDIAELCREFLAMLKKKMQNYGKMECSLDEKEEENPQEK